MYMIKRKNKIADNLQVCLKYATIYTGGYYV